MFQSPSLKPKRSKFLNKVKSNYLQSIKGTHRDYNKLRIQRDNVERKLMFKDMGVIARGSYQADMLLGKGQEEAWHLQNIGGEVERVGKGRVMVD